MANKAVSILIVLAVLLIIGNLYCVGMDIKDIYGSDDVVEMHITDDTAADDIIYYDSDDIVGKEYMVKWQKGQYQGTVVQNIKGERKHY